MTTHLKIAVFGAGAVGCYFGGMLARAGHEVVLIGRLEHVREIESAGLRLQTLSFDERVRLRASTDAGAVRGTSLVLVCVKASDTETAAQAMRPYLGPEAFLVSLQNGIDNAERLRTLQPQPVRAAVVYVAAEMAGPGHVHHRGRGELVVEPGGGGDAWVDAFRSAGVPVEISADVRQALWVKLILNCAYNALSAIGQVSYSRLVATDGVTDVMHEVVSECVAVARAEGVSIPAGIDTTVSGLAGSMPDQRSSTAHDLARGKRTEIEHLNGFIVQRGRIHGVPTPANQVLLISVYLLECEVASRRGTVLT